MNGKLNTPFKPPSKRSNDGLFPKQHLVSNKRSKVKVIEEEKDECTPLNASQLQKHTSSTDDPSKNLYYTCLYRTPQTKMHKTWDSDGFLVVKPEKSIKLCERDTRRYVTSDNLFRKARLYPDQEFHISSKDVKVIEQVKYEDIYEDRRYPLKENSLGNGTVSQKFKPPTMTTKVVEKKEIPSMEVQKEERIASSSFYGQSTSQRSVGILKRDKDDRKGPLYSSEKYPDLIAMKRPDLEHERKNRKEGQILVDVHINPRLSKTLREHQVKGVKFMYNGVMQMRKLVNSKEMVNGKDEEHPVRTPGSAGVILADDMGLGKTLQTITVIEMLLRQTCYLSVDRFRQTISKVLIICPTSLVRNWSNEFIKWVGKEIRVQCIEENSQDISSVLNAGNFEVLIINYEKARINIDKLVKAHLRFGLLVCDEAHRLKSNKSDLAKAFDKFKIDRRILLTGTPIQNNLMEFWTMMDFIAPNYLDTSEKFQRTFAEPIKRGRRPHCLDHHRQLAELRNRQLKEICEPLFLRREGNGHTQFLPTKHEIVVFCKPSNLQHQIYEALTSSGNMLDVIREKGRKPLEAIMILRKLCNAPDLVIKDLNERGSSGQGTKGILADIRPIMPACETQKYEDSGKLNLLVQLLRALRKKSDDKVVIVSSFVMVLEIVEMICKKLNFPTLRLDGKVKASGRMGIVNKFNKGNSEDTFIMLLSTKAGGVGLNLIGANRLILLDGDWNPANDEQAKARIHREGQKKECFIYRFLLSGTIDEKIFQRQISKLGLSEALLAKSDEDPLKSTETQTNEIADDFSDAELYDIFRYEDVPSTTHEMLQCPCKGEGVELDEEDLKSMREGDGSCLPEKCDFIAASQVRDKFTLEERKENQRKLSSLFGWTHHDFSKKDHAKLTKDDIINGIVENTDFSARPSGAIQFVLAKNNSTKFSEQIVELDTDDDGEENEGEEE